MFRRNDRARVGQPPRACQRISIDSFASTQEAAAHLKERALEFGADIVGIGEIEPSDVYLIRLERFDDGMIRRMKMLGRVFIHSGTGTSTGAPLSLMKNTTNLAVLLLLAFRPTR